MAGNKANQQSGYENISQVNQQHPVLDKKKNHGNVIIDQRHSNNVKKEENSTKKKTEIIKHKIPHNIPLWLVGVIGAVAVLIIIIVIYCCCKKCCGKKKKGKKEVKEKVDMKTVQVLGASYQEKVQPSFDELDYNSEEYHSDASSAVKMGRIHFTLEYSFNDNTLTVGVVEAEDIPAKDFSGTSDPYVKIYLLPDKKKRFETKIHRKTLNPRFNEVFVFKNVPYSDVANRTLSLEIYDFDRFSRHDLIGEAKLSLIDIDLAAPYDDWRVLTPPTTTGGGNKNADTNGDICFSLRYIPATGKLQVIILEAKNLKPMDVTGYSDPYAKISLIQEGRRIKKKKTTVKKRTLNPYFNETFSFQVAFEKIEQSSLMISVLDYDRLGRSEVIGKCVVGELASGVGQRHWEDMLASPRRPVAMWHALQS